MRDLIILRITDILIEDPSLQVLYDISPEELSGLSNIELIDLFEELI